MTLAKPKARLRAEAERTFFGALGNAVGEAVKRFSPAECADRLAALGYEPDQA